MPRALMPPRPSPQSLLLMAASAAGDSGALLLAALRGLRAVAVGGHRIRLLHSFSGGRLPRRPGVACGFMITPVARPASPVAVRSRNVHSAEVYKKAYEERLRQLIERLKKEGINPKQWRLGTFQRMLCPMCKGGSTEELSLSVLIRIDGKNATWNCFRSTCGWKGYVQPDGVSKVSRAKNDAGSETDKKIEANQAVNKVYRKICEEDLHLEPLSDEAIKYY